MLKNERFEELILITTSCLEAGVNIIDPDLKNIIVDIGDIGSLIQCIGRKRIQDANDKVNIYIKAIGNKQLVGIQIQNRKRLEKADFLREHTPREYIEKYPRQYDKSYIVYDAPINGIDDQITKKINELMYIKGKLDNGDISIMLTRGEYGYCKYVAELFGFKNEYEGYTYKFIKECFELENFDLINYLVNHKGAVILTQSERSELINKVNLRRNGKLIKNIDSINNLLRESKLPYRIRKFATSRIIDCKKKNFNNAWIIEEINC